MSSRGPLRLTLVEWLLILTISATALLTFLTAGCMAPHSPVVEARDTLVAPPPNNLPIMVKVRVVRVDGGFANVKLARKLVRARDIFASYGVGMEVVSATDVENPDWLAVDEADAPALDRYAKGIAEHVVFLVESISIKGVPAGGAGVSRWCAVSRVSWDSVIAHEICHASLKMANLDQQKGRDGHRNTPFNLMVDQGITEDHVRLEEDQVAVLKGWAKLRWGIQR